MGATITADFSKFANEANGQTDWRVSKQFMSRPADQRFRTMDELLAMLDRRTEAAVVQNVPLIDLRPVATEEGGIGFEHERSGSVLTSTNFSFAQYCQRLGVPPGLLTKRLASDNRLTADVMRHCLQTCDDPTKEVQMLRSDTEIRALTSTTYERIWDREMVRMVKDMCEASGIDWQVPVSFARPGEVRYSYVPTVEETTIYGSDRDVFVFLVDQANPIQVGYRTDAKTGERIPDVYSRGFYFWNGENGDISNGVGTFLYSWVCCNRSIRDQKGFQRISINHTKNAGERFVKQLLPQLKGFIEGSTTGIIDAIMEGKRRVLARDDDGRRHLFAETLGLGPEAATKVMAKCIDEEGRPVETVDDAIQALTAYARDIPFASERILVERKVESMLKDLRMA